MAAASAHPTIRTIVVGTDFSDASQHALRVAGDIAQARNATMLIVNAVDPMITTLEISPQVIIDDVRAGLTKAAASFESRGIKVETQLRLGKPWWAINEAAREAKAELVVIASHGRTGLAKLALGSTADRVLRSCDSPVLMIPITRLAANAHDSPSTWQSGLVAIDFSEESRAAATMAVELLSTSQAASKSIVLFHTIALSFDFAATAAGNFPTQQHWDREESVAREQLERLAAALASPTVKVKAVTHRGSPSDGIMREAASSKVDFIALGTHGRGAVARTVLGSVAERVVHLAACPVLTVRHVQSAAAAGESPAQTGSSIFRG